MNVNEMIDRITNKHTYLLGSGNLSAEAKSIVDNLNRPKKRVIMIGEINHNQDILNYFKKSSIYISASKSDGTSVSMIEATAYKLTLILSDIPNNRYWIQKNDFGFLFNHKNPFELAELLRRMLIHEISIEDRSLRANNGFRIVNRLGTFESFSERFVNLISQPL